MLTPATVIQSSNQSTGSGDSDTGGSHDVGYAATTEKPKLKKPPLYKVILVNDDYTPMDFVVDVLRSFFGMNVEKATQIMLKVHTCLLYTSPSPRD